MKTTTTMIAAAFLALLTAGAANAGINSDYASGPDACGGVDPDGVRSGAPIEQPPALCDDDGEDPTMNIVARHPAFRGCNQAPIAQPPENVNCSGGAVAFSDTASGYGNFDTDYPRAETVAFINEYTGAGTDKQARYTATVWSRDMVTGVYTSVNYATQCVAAGATFDADTVTAGVQPFTAAAGQTIDEVDIWTDFTTAPTTCDNLTNEVREVKFDFSYTENAVTSACASQCDPTVVAGDCGAGTATAITSQATGGTTFTWSACAESAAAGTMCMASIWVYVGEDTFINGYQAEDTTIDCEVFDSSTTTGINVCVAAGVTVSVVARVWAIGADWDAAFATFVCV